MCQGDKEMGTNIKDGLDILLRDLKKFIASRDLLVFLFFLVLSTIFWGLQALSSRYETVVRIPVAYEDIPKGFCRTEKLVDTLQITVADKGTSLLRYHSKMMFDKLGYGFDAVKVKRKNVNDVSYTIQTKNFSKQIASMLNSTTEIVSIKPDTIRVLISKIESKTVKVCLDANVDLATQYILKQLSIIPDRVEVFGTAKVLEGIDSVMTVNADSLFRNVNDNLRVSVPLKTNDDVSYGIDNVWVEVSTEQFTEKELSVVAVSVTNVPHGMKLRTFPSSVSVNCKIGVSGWEKIVPSSFTIVVDYNDIEGGGAKLPVRVAKQPEGAFDIRISPPTVEYLVEAK